MSEYVHHYSKIQVNNVAKVRDWLQAGSLPKSSLPLQTSKEVIAEAERMKTLSLNEVRGGELDSKAKDAISKFKEDFLNELRSMFPKQNPHQLYQVLIKNQFDLQKAIESLLDIPPSSTKSRGRDIVKTGSSFPEYRAATHVGNVVSGSSRTKPLHQLRTEITANSGTRRSSQTVSGTKSSLVSINVTSSTPHTLNTRSILTGHRSHQVSRSTLVSPVSPVSQFAALSPMPPCPECPVCFSSLAGSRIYQCAQGHSICGDCNKNLQVKNCPTCRGKLMGRATNMEQLLASIYSGE